MSNYESAFRSKITKSPQFDPVKYEFYPFQVMVIGFSLKSFHYLNNKLQQICSHCIIQYDGISNWLYASMENVSELKECLKLNKTMLNNSEMIAVRPCEQSNFSCYQQKYINEKCLPNKLLKRNNGFLRKLVSYLLNGWI